MSSENVEVVRRAWAAWITGDVEAVLDFFDPDVEWDTTTFEGWPEAGVHRGRDGVRRFLEQWLDVWERFESGVDAYMDAGDDRVVVLAWQRGYGADSHAPVEMDWAQVCTLRGGRLLRIDAYSDRRKALEAAG